MELNAKSKHEGDKLALQVFQYNTVINTLKQCSIIVDDVTKELHELNEFCLKNDIDINDSYFQMGGRFSLGDAIDETLDEARDLAYEQVKTNAITTLISVSFHRFRWITS
jgi:hypothetical protein